MGVIKNLKLCKQAYNSFEMVLNYTNESLELTGVQQSILSICEFLATHYCGINLRKDNLKNLMLLGKKEPYMEEILTVTRNYWHFILEDKALFPGRQLNKSWPEISFPDKTAPNCPSLLFKFLNDIKLKLREKGKALEEKSNLWNYLLFINCFLGIKIFHSKHLSLDFLNSVINKERDFPIVFKDEMFEKEKDFEISFNEEKTALQCSVTQRYAVLSDDSEINLRSQIITNDKIIKLSLYLFNHPEIKYLDFSIEWKPRERLSDKVSAYKLFAFERFSEEIKGFSLSRYIPKPTKYNEDQDKLFKKIKNLKIKNQNPIAKEYAKGLSYNTTLSSLVFDSGGLTDSGARFFCENTTLNEIKFKNSQITDEFKLVLNEKDPIKRYNLFKEMGFEEKPPSLLSAMCLNQIGIKKENDELEESPDILQEEISEKIDEHKFSFT